MPLEINELLEMNGNCQALVKELQASLPPGLRCALFIFTEGAGPVAFAHMSSNKKMISVMEDILRRLKEKGEGNSPLLIS